MKADIIQDGIMYECTIESIENEENIGYEVFILVPNITSEMGNELFREFMIKKDGLWKFDKINGELEKIIALETPLANILSQLKQ